MIPFPLEKKPQVSDQVLTVIAYQAIKTLLETGRSSQVIWRGEPPLLPVRKDNWELGPVTNEYTLPLEIQRRINILRNNDISIKQVLIAHEVPIVVPKPVETKKVEIPASPSPMLSPSTRRALLIGLAIVLAPFVLVGLAFVAAAILAPFVALYVLACGGDPVVVCVLEDDSWLMIGWWYE